MCGECGCGEAKGQPIAPNLHSLDPATEHRHADGTVHCHDHPHPPAPPLKTIALEQKVLAHNDAVAATNRQWLAARHVVAINLISAPGAGKTLLLEKTLERLRGRVPCAVIAGDQETDRDAQRLRGKGAPVVQIQTHSACHLDAQQVQAVLPEVVRDDTRLLFIENVGNLVCPAAFDLGEHFKVALLSATEGEDKPLKYPALFSLAGVVVLTKLDLAPHLDWDRAACRQNVQRIHPGVFMFELSAKTGAGMDAWLDYLATLPVG